MDRSRQGVLVEEVVLGLRLEADFPSADVHMVQVRGKFERGGAFW